MEAFWASHCEDLYCTVHPRSVGSPCVIYVNYVGLPAAVADALPHGLDFVADLNALYTIIPSDQKLRPNARSILTTVTPKPKNGTGQAW